MPVLDLYLRDLRETHATGEAVKETSFYPALSNLLNGVGAQLNPKVRVVINTKNRGAGLPDGGLFTARQLKKLGGDEAVREPASFKGQQPERGVVEVKGAKENVHDIAANRSGAALFERIRASTGHKPARVFTGWLRRKRRTPS